jgi:hypothetical protein
MTVVIPTDEDVRIFLSTYLDPITTSFAEIGEYGRTNSQIAKYQESMLRAQSSLILEPRT